MSNKLPLSPKGGDIFLIGVHINLFLYDYFWHYLQKSIKYFNIVKSLIMHNAQEFSQKLFPNSCQLIVGYAK
jgi:hypothetical protein